MHFFCRMGSAIFKFDSLRNGGSSIFIEKIVRYCLSEVLLKGKKYPFAQMWNGRAKGTLEGKTKPQILSAAQIVDLWIYQWSVAGDFCASGINIILRRRAYFR